MIDNKKLITFHGVEKPQGKVNVSGAKNSATRLITASLLSDETSIIYNFPTKILDAQNIIKFLQKNGINAIVDHQSNQIEINASAFFINNNNLHLPVRTTYLLAAGQLMRHNEAIIPYPSGCNIGLRKIDLHIMVWRKMNVQVIEKENYIYLKSKRLNAANIDFPFPTIGGTENALLCASVADGISRIKNAYLSPEVMDLINFLRSMGAIIRTRGNSFVEVVGQKYLKGATHVVIPDRIEALTWIVYGILSGGSILVNNIPFDEMRIPLIHLKNAGINFFSNTNSILINQDCYPEGIQPFQLACGTYPGVISDMQPFFTLLALKANGRSLIIDYRYPERTQYLNELNKCLPKETITFDNKGSIHVNGIADFLGGNMTSTDLRGSMALIIFALCSNHEVIVKDIDKALRGYNDFFEKLHDLGVRFNIK